MVRVGTELADGSGVAPRRPRVAILGAGAAGLCMGIRLLQEGIEDFTIFERSTASVAPGATTPIRGACDVPSHL